MSTSGVVIVGQIFLVLIAIAGVLLYYLNNLNDELQSTLNHLREKLRDEKRHSKGLHIKIQEQHNQINSLQARIDADKDSVASAKTSLRDLEREYEALQQQIQKQEKSLKFTQNKLEQSQQALDQALQTIETLKSERQDAKRSSPENNYEELYHDLKNAIAYNMSGGEEVLDILRERLRENGNFHDSDKLSELKERYNSLGEMVGRLEEVELFGESQLEEDTDELAEINAAESLLKEAEALLNESQLFVAPDSAALAELQQDQAEMLRKLEESYQNNRTMKQQLDVVTRQLMAFVAKARLFQAQKEQIRMHKATQNQMHRNFVSLSNEHKTLNRKYKNLQAENKILQAQVLSDEDNPVLVKKLESLRAQLEEKEAVMDRLKIENEMLEQQFLTISKESNFQQESADALARLTSEHQLLEQQFLEVLQELEGQSANG